MKIIDGAMYGKWHDIYTDSSNEKEKVVNKLLKVIEGIKEKGSFLDIGASSGDLTFLIAPHFVSSTVVEPNNAVKSKYENSKIKFINETFQDAVLEEKFDLILCSHVFWLVKKEEQINFVRKMYQHLRPGGKFVNIMMAPIFQAHELHQKFFLNYDMTTHDILNIHHSLGYVTEVIPVDVEFRTETFDDFFSICKLFTMQSWLHPTNLTDSDKLKKIGNIDDYTDLKLKELEEYIRDTCYRENNYSMKMGIELLVVNY